MALGDKISGRQNTNSLLCVNMSIASLWYNIGDETPYLPVERSKNGKETVSW